jgi:3-dehydroquinate synthase
MAVTCLELRHRDGITPILVGRGALQQAARELEDWLADRRVFVVTSPRVRQLQGRAIERFVGGAAVTQILEVAEGEAAKSLQTAEGLWRRMLVDQGKRDSRLVAFGGGSVGDLAGFVAGAFLRGVEYVHVPTTLLAQVDASIGGKTGVNLPEAKNSVGLLYHPRATVCDTELLTTLPVRELRSGLFEIVKIAVVSDADLFRRLEDDLGSLMSGDPELLGEVVGAAAAAKIRIVERDPTELGQRKLLNFGHTLAHALEAALSYEELRHGEAVGYGMLFALELAVERGLLEGEAERVRRLVGGLGLPSLPFLSPEGVFLRLQRDKKSRESGLIWVLPVAIGEGAFFSDFTPTEIAAKVADFLPNS